MAARGSAARQYSVLIATILRFPEVASVSFDPFTHEIRTQFLVRRVLSGADADEVRARLADALAAYAALERKPEAIRDLVVAGRDGGVSTVTAHWRARDLEAAEIGLTVEFLRDHLGDDLLLDEEPASMGDEVGDEELYMGEELIAEKIADLSRLRGERRLVACRDEGRLIVYHK